MTSPLPSPTQEGFELPLWKRITVCPRPLRAIRRTADGAIAGPGSSLFLFEGLQTVNAGDSSFTSPFIGSSRLFRYLHCGDFRASPRHALHPAVKGKNFHHIYLDTTYLDPKVWEAWVSDFMLSDLLF